MADTEPSLPPIASSPLSMILLPGKEGNAAEVVAAWTSVLDGLGRDYEILVPEMSDGPAEQTPRVRVLRQTSGKGAGAVLRAALATARHPLVCCAPCDRQYQPAELKLL